jgi:hypothetical protein
MKRALSNVAVTVLAAYALALIASAASAFWTTPGTLGFTTDYGATVRAVTPGGPAARAGIVAGDAIRLSATPFDERRYVSGIGAPVPAGATVDFNVVDEGTARDVRLRAVAAPLAVADRWTLLIACVSSLVFIAVGVLLIVLRPSQATWGFGLYCLLALPVAAYPLAIPDARTALVATLAYDVVQNLGIAGLLLFALSFPQPFDVAWRNRLRNALPAVAIVLALMTLYPDVQNLLRGEAAGFENRILQLTFGAAFAVAIAIVWDTYRRTALDARERVQWVLIGVGIGLIANYIGTTLYFSTLIVANPPAWLVNVLLSLNVLLPLAVAHAVVRHRVLDVNVVIGRALVFAAMTTVLAAIFSLLDWVFGSVLEDFRLSRVLAAVISIAIAFAFSHVEKLADTAIETVFFRKRRSAEAVLERLIRALPHARSMRVIEAALVGDVVEMFGVASATLYRAGDDGAFVRSASAGTSDGDPLADGGALVAALRESSDIVDLDALPAQPDRPALAGRDPLIAVPMRSHAELAGFVLYGGHANGSELDPDERALLERLVAAAGLAFDQIEAQRLRAENERQSAIIAELRARLGERRP